MLRLTVLLLLLAGNVAAQKFKLMRFDEDYSYLKDSVKNCYQQIKYLPLAASGKAYMSFGGEARLEYAMFYNENWGAEGLGRNSFLLQRYDVHADIHISQNIRVFAQLRSAWEKGRKDGPRPIDEDKLNIQNLFLDVKLINKERLGITARLGRQELNYGSGRLISVREGPNLRMYFTGAKLLYQSKRLSADAFLMVEDTMNTGAWDNKPSHQANLWGLYGSWTIPRSGNVDFYYLGTHRNAEEYNEGIATETRHTIGARFWRYGGGFIYNLEGAWQFGDFGGGNINAWTASADLGYMFEEVKGKPAINLRNDYISGDRTSGDHSLQTFNPLYPKGGYFGFNPQIGPVNLIDIHPYATINVGNRLSLQADAVFNWRFSLDDGLYRPSGNFNISGKGSDKRYIGTAWLASGVYSFSKLLSTNVGIQYFKSGSFIKDVITDYKDGLFINARVALKF